MSDCAENFVTRNRNKCINIMQYETETLSKVQFTMDEKTFKHKGFNVLNYNHPKYCPLIIESSVISTTDYSRPSYFYYTSTFQYIYELKLKRDINKLNKNISHIKYNLKKSNKITGMSKKRKTVTFIISFVKN